MTYHTRLFRLQLCRRLSKHFVQTLAWLLAQGHLLQPHRLPKKLSLEVSPLWLVRAICVMHVGLWIEGFGNDQRGAAVNDFNGEDRKISKTVRLSITSIPKRGQWGRAVN